MGQHFAATSGVDSFVIDQTVTVDFPGGDRSWVPGLLASIANTLAEHGGTAASSAARYRRHSAAGLAWTP